MLEVPAGLLLGVCACSEATPPNTVEKTIGPAGGLISSHDQVLTIVLQPGAVSSDVDIQIWPSDEPPAVWGPAYRVTPDIDLMVDAQVSYRRLLPNNPNSATVGAIHLEDYTSEMGFWDPLTRIALDPELELVTSVDSQLSLYYGLLELSGAPPLPSDDGGNDDANPPSDEGTTGDDSGMTSDAMTDEGTTAGVDPTTGGGEGPGETTDGETSRGMDSSDGAVEEEEGGSTDDGGPVFACDDGMLQAGELCLVLGNTYITGNGPIDIEIGAFDGDAALDVVTLDAGAMELGFLAGAGDGSFAASVTAAALTGTPTEILSGTFAGNATLDIAALGTAVDSVGLLVGDGTGVFAAPIDTAAGVGVVDFDSGDFNADGTLDIVTLNVTESTVQLLLGDAAGFGLGANAIVNADSLDLVAVGDLSGPGDTNDDVVGVGAGNFHAWAGNGTGNGWVGNIPGNFAGGGGNYVELATGDVNGDGNDDLVAIDATANTVVVGVSTGGPASYIFLPAVNVGTAPSNILLFDLDGEGEDEAVVTNAGSGDVTILDWNGAAYVEAFSFDVGMAPSGAVAGQVDGDGVPDIVVASEGESMITVLLSNP